MSSLEGAGGPHRLASEGMERAREAGGYITAVAVAARDAARR